MAVLRTWYGALYRIDVWFAPTVLGIFLLALERFNYLTFHTVAELFSIIISFVLFAFAWSTDRFTKNTYLLFLACGYFWIGSLDLIHALVYRGMDLIVNDKGGTSTQFWIGARYFEAILLMSAPILSRRNDPKWGLFLAFGFIAIALTTAIFTGNFPTTFVDGIGLTPFKIYSEYVIVLILFVALIVLHKVKEDQTSAEKGLISAAIVVTMFSELTFSSYASVYDYSNVVGHILKIYSFWFLFRAVVIYNLKLPFQAQIDSENKFLEIARMSNIGTYDLDVTTLTWQRTDPLNKVFGITPSHPNDVAGWLSIVHPEDREEVQDYFLNTVIGNKQRFDKSYRIVRQNDQEVRWVHGIGDLVLDANGEATKMLGLIQDISSRVRDEMLREAQLDIAEKSLLLGETETIQRVLEWAEKLTDSSISFFHFVNPDQETIELITWSKRTLSEYCNVEKIDTHYPISQAGIWADAFRERRPVVINDYAQAQHKKGLPHGHAHLERLISMPLIEGDQVRVLLGVGNNIGPYTERDVARLKILIDQAWHNIGQKRAEKHANLLMQAVEQSPASIIMTDVMGKLTYTNPAFSKTTGYTSEETKEKTLRQLITDDESDLWDTVTAGATWSGQIRNRKKDGSSCWASIVASPLQDSNNKTTGYIVISEDITDRMQTEVQLLQAQKVSAIGQMASGIAHDINNMLMPIIGLGELIKKDLSNDPKQAKRFDKILEAANRARGLLKDIVNFGRTEELRRSIVDITELTTRAMDIIRPAIPSTLSITTDFANEIGTVLLDEDAYISVLMNFSTNARDAMKDGRGKLHISITKVFPNEELCRSVPGLVMGKPYALITASDSGIGMSQDTLQKIFDPFFTTKDVGKGVGLGLLMVHDIIQKNDGVIRVRSELGQWTEFEVYFPIVTEEQ